MDDFTQVSYFGTGPASLDALRTQYRVRYADVIAYGTARLTDVLTFEIRGGALANVQLPTPTGPLRRDLPYTAELFPDEPVFALTGLPRFTHAVPRRQIELTHRGGHTTCNPSASTRLKSNGWFAGVHEQGAVEVLRQVQAHGGVYRAGWSAYWASAAGTRRGHEYRR